jgi:hypothetical protein
VPRLRQRLVRAAPAATAAAVAVAGLLAGVRLAGPMEHRTPLGDVRVQVVPALDGQVDGFIPLADWGVRADAFDAPIRISVEPRGVDRPALLRAVDGDRRVIAAAEADLAAAGRRSLLRALACGILATVLLAAFASCGLAAGGRRERRLLLGLPAAAAALATGLGAGALWQVERSFRLEAFQHPTFYARGAEMQQLLGAAEKARRSGQRYGTQVEGTLSSFASLLADASSPASTTAAARSSPPTCTPTRSRSTPCAAWPAASRCSSPATSATTAILRRCGCSPTASPGCRARSWRCRATTTRGTLMRRLAARGVLVLTERGRLRADGSTAGPPWCRSTACAWRGTPTRSSGGAAIRTLPGGCSRSPSARAGAARSAPRRRT